MLIAGPSGSGKTILLNILARGTERIKKTRTLRVSGDIDHPNNARIGTLRRFSSDRSLVELLGGRDVNRAIYALNAAGLSEPQLYLKRFDELSAGQQYRAMIARLIDGGRNIWLADEFCSMLDAVTTTIVAQNLRRLATKYGATLIVATAHWQHLIKSLQPDRVLYLMSGREYRVFTGREFLKIAKSADYSKV